jgi:oligopeptide/dipeptide ABC transporter ATP-binding protein
MLQRVLVAMAMFGEPRLLIGDEPTSAVDAILRYEILDFLHDRCRNQGMALLLATHDLSIVRTYADRVVVLYAGRIVEMSKKDRFFNKPLHPYSAMLVASAPETFARLKPLPGTEGKPSTEMSASEGCRFSPRCPRVQDDCRIAEPALIPIDEESKVRCPYWK